MTLSAHSIFPREPSGAPPSGAVSDSTDFLYPTKGDEDVQSLHTTNWIWDTALLTWKRWDGRIDTVVSGDLNVSVDNLEQYVLDTLSHYKLSNWLVSSSVVYLGYLAKDGSWYIKKIDTSAGTVLYCKGASSYSFSAPAALSYSTFDVIF
jgi:hypothetical protein